jgi:hypothetical protein
VSDLDETTTAALVPLSPDDEAGAMERALRQVLNVNKDSVREYVAQLRAAHPDADSDELAAGVVSRRALKAGGIGAITGLGGMVTLPVAIPANLVGTWRVQTTMLAVIAEIYDAEFEVDDFFLVLGGSAVTEAMKQFGVLAGKDVTKRMVEKHVTRETMKAINRVVSRQIITKAGTKSATSFMKLVPLVGAPVGFAFDWTATRAFGKAGIRYYAH